MSSISYIPTQTNDIQSQVDKLIELGLATEKRKTMEAQNTLDSGFRMIQMGIAPDYNKMTQAAKRLGYPIPASAEEWANAKAGMMQPTPSVDPNQAAKAGNAMQGNKAGAQAGTPPSTSAANKAPGGGVVKPGAAPSTQMVQGAVGQAGQQGGGFQQGLANMTQAVQTQQARQQDLASDEYQLQKTVNRLQNQIASDPNNIDWKDVGKLMLLTGQTPNRDVAEWISMTPEQRQHALDVEAGIEETLQAKNDRIAQTTASLINGGQLQGILENQDDIAPYAKAVAEGGDTSGFKTLPNPSKAVTEGILFNQFAPVVGAKYAKEMARLGANGGDPMGAIPEGAKDLLQDLELALREREVGAQELSALADWKRLELALKQAELEAKEKNTRLAKAIETLEIMSKMKAAGLEPEEEQVTEVANIMAEELGIKSLAKPGWLLRTWRSITSPLTQEIWTLPPAETKPFVGKRPPAPSPERLTGRNAIQVFTDANKERQRVEGLKKIAKLIEGPVDISNIRER